MLAILSRRIRTTCDEDLKWFREQVIAVADQDALAEGVEGVNVATAMQQKPSVITRGLSVDCPKSQPGLEKVNYLGTTASCGDRKFTADSGFNYAERTK